MKFLLFYRVVVVLMLAISPFAVKASSWSSDKPVRRTFAEKLPMFQDSTARKKPANKPQEVQKPPQNDQEGRPVDIQRRSIKQVPRSLPKLKPQPVPHQGQIQRPIKGRRN